MKKGKRLLSAVLCAAMVFTSLTTPRTMAQAATRAKTLTLNVKSNVIVKNTTEGKVVIPLDKKKNFKMSLTSKASNFTFSSSRRSVATVSVRGIVKAKKTGKAKITVKGKKGTVKGAKQTVTVYVAKKSVKSVSLNAR